MVISVTIITTTWSESILLINTMSKISSIANTSKHVSNASLILFDMISIYLG